MAPKWGHHGTLWEDLDLPTSVPCWEKRLSTHGLGLGWFRRRFKKLAWSSPENRCI